MYYAIRISGKGGNTGIYPNWPLCKKNLGSGYIQYKKFPSLKEAVDWFNAGTKSEKKFYNEELKKFSNFTPVIVPKSKNIDPNLNAKALELFKRNEAKLKEKEAIKQRDLEILRKRALSN